MKYWLILDLLAFLLITLREDAKDFYKVVLYDLENQFYFQWILFIIFVLMYLPFTIPYSIIKILKRNYDN